MIEYFRDKETGLVYQFNTTKAALYEIPIPENIYEKISVDEYWKGVEAQMERFADQDAEQDS